MIQTSQDQLLPLNSPDVLQREIEQLRQLLAEKDELIRSQKVLQQEPIIVATEKVLQLPIDLEIEVVDDKFLVNSRIEILYILRSMMRSKSLTTLTFGDDVILTTIIGIDLKRREIIFDSGAHIAANLRAVKSHNLKASSFLNQVPIYFTCLDLDEIEFEGACAFRAKFPKCLRRIQKRESFRTDIPGNIQLKFKLPISEGVFSNTFIKNISQGGMLVIDPSHEVPFEIGVEYQGGLIDLTSVGIAKVSVQVRSVSEVTQRDGTKCLRAGLEFTDATEQRALTMIQHYLIKLKKEGQEL